MTSPGAFVIFGATGDLARRMLFPSLYFLDMDGLLPSALKIIGAARSRHSVWVIGVKAAFFSCLARRLMVSMDFGVMSLDIAFPSGPA